MKTLDRVFGWLLVVNGLLHALGAWNANHAKPDVLLWALTGSLAALLIAAINLLRAARPHDRPLAWLGLAGSLAWLAVALSVGKLVGNFLDARVVSNALNAAVLAALSIRSLNAGQRTGSQAAA
jgi:predicted small integral membrane protein